MLGAIAKFELRYHLRQPLFYILFLCYFLLTFAAVTTDAVQVGGAVGNVNRNAPFVIMQFLLVFSIFGILTTTAFVANSVHRDFELNTYSLFFSSPIHKGSYLGGRFLGSFAVAVMVYLGVITAIMFGSVMPWLEKERLGPFELTPYLYSLFVLVVPNLLLAGAIFFAVAALTRSLMATYSAVVGFFVAYGIAGSLLGDVENETVAGLLDPFGFGAFALTTRYWTVHQRNTELLPLDGLFLWNRILWSAIALAVLLFAYWRFAFRVSARSGGKKRKLQSLPAETEPIQRIALTLPRVSQTFGAASSWRQFLAAVRLECSQVFKSIPFIIILLLGVFNTWGISVNANEIFSTPSLPVTHVMVDVINGGFVLFGLIIAAFYAGDMVWRERSLKLHEVRDAMPTPTWSMWAAKLVALVLVVYATLTAAILTTMLIQTSKGYFNYELGVYAKGVYVDVGGFLLMIAAFAFVLQALLNQKFVGFLGVMLYFIVNRALPALDYEHRLYRFASRPPSQYSDMNGWGHFVAPQFWFMTYWLLFIGALLVAGHLLWVRGTESAFRSRLRLARVRFGKAAAATLAVLLLGFVSTGCYIYYNTNVLNEYTTEDQNEKRAADFEKKYKKFDRIPQPRITDVQADVDIHPEKRAVYIRGRYQTVNKTGAPISELHVTMNPDVTSSKITIPGATVKSADAELGYTIYRLAQPLAPGASLPVSFDVRVEEKGFRNGAANNEIVENGTFINNFSYFPHFGYLSVRELQDRNDRRKYGLGPIERMRPATDMKARMNNPLTRDSDWINLDTTVSTSADQIAVAPGYLQREWNQNGRRYFHYKTTSPILGFWSYLSARYTVRKDKWVDPQGNAIPIEIYYDARHPYNVDRMIYAVKKSLAYFTKNFTPYQHRQVRVLEFPNYRRFAQSFPNTIPYSESIGFIADLRDKNEIDSVFYVTAHEVAHQWWAHQVIGGDVQGSTMLIETLSQYSALMVMEEEYGPAQMRKFLRVELDRYLAGRGGELVAEMPVSQVENQQYIHYNKGSLVMYALRDYIGEERVNAALAKFLRDYGFQQPPYTTAAELVRYFRAVTPPEYQNVITDLFESVTLFDNRVKEATATKRADGKYLVKLTVESSKLKADAKGEEKTVPIDDWIDIGVFAAGKNKDDLGQPLFTEKRRITKPVETFELVVPTAPAKAGIDPFNKLIDRNPRDNTKSL